MLSCGTTGIHLHREFVSTGISGHGGGSAPCRVWHTLTVPSAGSKQSATPAPSNTVFGLINIRSLLNKNDDVIELFHDHSFDVLCLTETWHDADSVYIRRLRAEGHQVVDRPLPRSSVNAESLAVNHDGVAVVAAPIVRLTTVDTDIHPTSFEHVSVRIVVNKSSCTVVVIYRPGSEAIQSVFFDELGDVLDCIATFAEPIYMVGDFKVRLGRADDVHASRLLDLLNTLWSRSSCEWSDSSSRGFTGRRGYSQ